MEKYCLTNNTIYIAGNCLYQIKALKNFGKVKKGDYKEMTIKEYIDYLEAEAYSPFLVERKRHYLYNLLERLKALRNNM